MIRKLNPWIALAMILGCQEPLTPATSEAAYTAELLACVNNAKDREASYDCRVSVNQRWGVCLPTGDCRREELGK